MIESEPRSAALQLERALYVLPGDPVAAHTDPRGVVSPAHYGLRGYDANGDIIFDTIGVSQVMSLLGSASRAWAVRHLAGVGSGGGAGISGNGGEVVLQTVNFSLTRQANVMVLGASAGNVGVNAALGSWFFSAPIYIKTDSTNSPAAALPAIKTNAAVTPIEAGVSVFQVIQLGAGSHTSKLIWNSQNGTNDTFNEYADNLAVFLLGG